MQPSISHLKKVAKRLHKSLKGSQPPSLMQVQHIVAQSYGFKSWDEVVEEPQIQIARTVEELKAQLDHDLRGDKDAHDLAIDALEARNQEAGLHKHRIATIYNKVSVYDVLKLMDVSVGPDEMIKCPFHDDRIPSAKIFSRNHVWCYGCKEPGWDVIELWRKFNTMKMGDALTSLEQTFRLGPYAYAAADIESLVVRVLGSYVDQVTWKLETVGDGLKGGILGIWGIRRISKIKCNIPADRGLPLIEAHLKVILKILNEETAT